MTDILSFLKGLELGRYFQVEYLKYLAVVCAALFLLSLFGRRVSGGPSVFCSAIGTAIGIFFMYMIVVAIRFADLVVQIPTLPFVDVVDDHVYLLPITSTDFRIVCLDFLQLLILAFFVAVLDGVIPRSENLIFWSIRSIFLLFLSFLCQSMITYGFVTYAPAFILQYAPVILLGFLVFVMFLGLIRLVLGVALAAVNPILAGIYGFFFMHRIGKKISTAVIATMLLGVILALTDYFGYSVISLAGGNLLLCTPFLLLLLFFWFLV